MLPLLLTTPAPIESDFLSLHDALPISRVTSLGVLTASIAHEINQPLSGIITNAGTCLRMLSADPPNVEGVGREHRSEEHTSELQSLRHLECRLLLAEKNERYGRTDQSG